MTRKALLLGILILTAASLRAHGAETAAAPKPAAAPAAAPLPPGVMFRVNGKDIPREKFIAELDAALGESYRETFIGHVLVEDQASKSGITASEAEIDARVRANMDQVLGGTFGGDQDRMKEALEERGMTLDGWKKRLRLDARSDVLLEKLVRKDRQVSDDTLKRAFEERYGPGGTQVKVRHILKNVLVAASQEYTLQQYDLEKGKIEDDARKRADEALAKLRSGTAFETVMAEYSDDPRKGSGGALTSWKGRFGADFDAAAAKLVKNGVKLVSITQEMGDGPMHVMMRQIMALFDEHQSKENAKRVLRVLKENARQGLWSKSSP